jgi:hypothetical protein
VSCILLIAADILRCTDFQLSGWMQHYAWWESFAGASQNSRRNVCKEVTSGRQTSLAMDPDSDLVEKNKA